MSNITIGALTLANTHNYPTTVGAIKLRIWYTGCQGSNFRDSLNNIVMCGNGSSSFYTEVPVTLAGTTLSIPPYVLPSTDDSSMLTVLAHAKFYVNGVPRDNLFSNWIITNTLGASIAYDQLFDFNIIARTAPGSGQAQFLAAITALILSLITDAVQGILSEIPTGLVDGVNTTFTLTETPVSGSLLLFVNKQLQQEGVDYTLSGQTITFVVAPLPGDWLFAAYRTASGLLGIPIDLSAGLFINPKDAAYGAVGDGATNDAAAFQLAINAAVNLGLPIYIPAGDYFTGSTVLVTPTMANGKLTIIGAGKGRARITRTNGVAATTLDIKLTGASSVVELANFTIVGPTGLGFDNASIGIQWLIPSTFGPRFRMDQIQITGTHDAAVQISGGLTAEAIDCDLAATDVCFGMFESSNTIDGASFYARGGVWQTPDGDLSSVGSVGLYIHPHVPYLVEGVTFKTIGRYAFYQNGTPGAARKYANAIGCVLINCELAQTKNTGTSNFVGCQVRGTSNGLGSSLGGRVNLTGCVFNQGGQITYGPIVDSKVTIGDCTFLDTLVFTCGDPVGEWEIRSSTFRITDNSTAGVTLVRCVSGRTILDNVAFIDETVSLSYNAFVSGQGTAPVVKANHVSTKGGRGALSSGFYSDVGTLQVENCNFDAGAQTFALRFPVGFPVNGLTGSNNTFVNGATILVSDTATQQRLVRRVGMNPTSIASAASMSSITAEMCNYDTHVVTGSAAIANLTDPHVHVGILRLVVAAGATWSTASTGNITPTTTAPRRAGTIVTLFWEPTAAKWVEISASGTIEGVAVLAAGIATSILNTSVAADSAIGVFPKDSGITGNLHVSNRVAGVSFEVTSDNGADAGSFKWIIYL